MRAAYQDLEAELLAAGAGGGGARARPAGGRGR